jgi:hypothetical protein
MNSKDELLQQQLQALEQGAELEDVLAQLSEEDRELVGLVRLASQIRSLDHPQPKAASLPALQRNQNPSLSRRIVFLGGSLMAWVEERMVPANRRSLVLPAVAMGAVFVLLLAFALLGGTSGVDTAVAQGVTGQVEMALGGDPLRWQPLKNGDRVPSGAHLRTARAASAALVYADGSRTLLQPGTELSLTSLNGRRGGPVQAVLYQQAGVSRHEVVPFEEGKGLFMVYTPQGVVTVHGTVFNIAVDPQGRSRYSVDAGVVMVTSEESQVYLYPGQMTLSAGEALEFPAYRFTLHGTLQHTNGSIWTVAGVPITLLEETVISESPHVGDFVWVEGRVLESSEWVADRIGVEGEKTPESWFTGMVESASGEAWTISGWEVLVDENTYQDAGLVPGSAVRVVFEVLENGRWRAVSIVGLAEQPPVEVVPTPLPTETPAETPVVTPVETPVVTPDVELTPEPTATPTPQPDPDTDLGERVEERQEGEEPEFCVGVQPHPTGTRLALRYDVTYGEIMGWFCQGFGFGEIDLAYELSEITGENVTVYFLRRKAGEGWGEIRQEIYDQYGRTLKPDKPGKPEVPGKPEAPGKPEVPGKQEKPGRPENPGSGSKKP